MNYELIKKLKDGGFIPKIVVICNKGHECYADKEDCNLVALNQPTLIELIEACLAIDAKREKNQGHFLLSRSPDGEYRWYARTLVAHGDGDSAEEAVANLWLLLKEKQ